MDAINTRLANALDLERELEWLKAVIALRLRLHFEEAKTLERVGDADIESLPAPDLAHSSSVYAALVEQLELDWRERLALILAMVPDLRPSVLDVLLIKNEALGRRFTEFGGTSLDDDPSLHPTAETLAFLFGGNGLWGRFLAAELLDPDHRLVKAGVLILEREDKQPPLKARLRVSPDMMSLLTIARELRPALGADFPARHIETSLGWEDLVLHPSTRRQIDDIQIWLEHGRTLLEGWNMAGKLRPGYRALFHGPPGTGKSVTACLLGTASGRDVYRVDLSMVVSKWVGETEKNLAKVFDRAQHRGWILFFDEAEALFGKRGETKEANDRYANQEVAYLLQRVETFDGVAILASNMRDNLDDAFTRRFESVVYFPMPRPREREELWRRAFPEQAQLTDDVDLGAIARAHELAGGSIMNLPQVDRRKHTNLPAGHRTGHTSRARQGRPGALTTTSNSHVDLHRPEPKTVELRLSTMAPPRRSSSSKRNKRKPESSPTDTDAKKQHSDNRILQMLDVSGAPPVLSLPSLDGADDVDMEDAADIDVDMDDEADDDWDMEGAADMDDVEMIGAQPPIMIPPSLEESDSKEPLPAHRVDERTPLESAYAYGNMADSELETYRRYRAQERLESSEMSDAARRELKRKQLGAIFRTVLLRKREYERLTEVADTYACTRRKIRESYGRATFGIRTIDLFTVPCSRPRSSLARTIRKRWSRPKVVLSWIIIVRAGPMPSTNSTNASAYSSTSNLESRGRRIGYGIDSPAAMRVRSGVRCPSFTCTPNTRKTSYMPPSKTTLSTPSSCQR